MHLFDSVRARTALVGAAGALLLLSTAVPGAAASGTSRTITYTITSNNSVTNFVPCPAGTPITVIACGYGANEAVSTVTNDAGDLGLSSAGNVTISFVSELQAPVATPTCPQPVPQAGSYPDGSAITIHTTRGDIYLVSQGAFCATTNSDVEPYRVVGGTGEYAGATGSGVANAYATAPRTATQGFSADTYTGTLTLAN